MRRRRKQPDSSLDLFLDVVCNAFGGIILVAILLSIVVLDRTQQPAKAQEMGLPMSADESRETLVNIDRLESLRTQLSGSIAVLRELQPKPEQTEILGLQEELDQIEKELEKTVHEQSQATQQLAEALRESAELREDLDNLEQQLIEAQAALETDRKALDEALDEQLEVLKLPQVERTAKPNVILVMKYGRVFPVYEANSERPDTQHVSVNQAGIATRITPKIDGGWYLAKAADQTKLIAYLNEYSPYQNILSIGVWPDSFENFAAMKAIAIENGFQYQLWPLPDVPSLDVTPSSDFQRVQ